jgi:hypothetical protein
VTPTDIVQELFSPGHIRRYHEGDEARVDELVAKDMVNHAAGPL